MADVVDDALPVYIIGTFTNFHEEIAGHVCTGPSCQREAAVLGLYLGRVVVQRLCTTCASAQAIRWERPEKVRPPRRFQHQERPTASVSRARVVELFRGRGAHLRHRRAALLQPLGGVQRHRAASPFDGYEPRTSIHVPRRTR